VYDVHEYEVIVVMSPVQQMVLVMQHYQCYYHYHFYYHPIMLCAIMMGACHSSVLVSLELPIGSHHLQSLLDCHLHGAIIDVWLLMMQLVVVTNQPLLLPPPMGYLRAHGMVMLQMYD
jgi:hypothetical protein